jgi:hypothetical protein
MAILTQRSVDALQPRTKWYAVWDDDPHGFGLRIWPSGRKVYVVKYELRGSRKDQLVHPGRPCCLENPGSAGDGQAISGPSPPGA